MPVEIRPMTEADLAALPALLKQLGYDVAADAVARRFAQVMAAPDQAAWVATVDGRVAGMLHAYVRVALQNPREAVVEALVVDQTCRRSGAGGALMAAAERWAAAHGLNRVALSSNVVRDDAHAFYAAQGYRVSATAKIFRKTL
jgi:GNAT superfamily N-acetyltransferase